MCNRALAWVLTALLLLTVGCMPQQQTQVTTDGIPEPGTSLRIPTIVTTLPIPTTGKCCRVTFVLRADSTSEQIIQNGEFVQQPAVESFDGKIFAGWYLDPDYVQPYDFTTPVIQDLTLYAKWTMADMVIAYSYAGYECAAFEWECKAVSTCKVGYRLEGEDPYIYVDAPLIRAVDENRVRVDILGLVGGGVYDFLIESEGGSTTLENVQIAAYDRSGYAHFGYTEGVGAYCDNGRLKDGALVVYLTEENKNNVVDSAYVDGKKVDISAYIKSLTGIGEMLNNRRYNGTDRYNVGIAKLCEVYGAVTIRVIGRVEALQNADNTSTIRGLTDYNSQGNGGSVGDNGRMARMVNAKNLTIEGVGEDACIDGWGIHFIADDEGNQYPGAGESFEVRNLSFRNYPEDAVGMEGQQDGDYRGQLTDPVQRCWIHHNSFYPGYCADPAESDKAQGDGSCDFKRGRYYTLSYNYFVDCHKTNLIGSGDDSLQFDITFHHNYWENCGSRIPLLRNANFHFYNNYVFCDITQDYGATGAKLSLSYVASIRANSYLFSENNYYDGCKSIAEIKSGGAAKAWGNTYYACFKTDGSMKVSDREKKIPNNCKYIYGGIDYSSFDTDPTLFYYNAAEKRSDCYMTDAVTARIECMLYSGVQKRTGTQTHTQINHYTPEAPLQFEGSELVIDLSKITQGATVNGIYFNGKNSSGRLKGKHQVVTFTLTEDTWISVSVSATKAENMGELVDSTGEVWSGKFTEFSGVLPAGTYFIASGSKDKEIIITDLRFSDVSS